MLSLQFFCIFFLFFLTKIIQVLSRDDKKSFDVDKNIFLLKNFFKEILNKQKLKFFKFSMKHYDSFVFVLILIDNL